ncbi:hypothetical protein GCM10010103_63900 [Streptomyces paradoxus]
MEPGVPQFWGVTDVVQPCCGDEEVPVSFGHSRSSFLSSSSYRLSVQPAVSEPGEQRLGEFGRSLGRVQCRRHAWNGSRDEQ